MGASTVYKVGFWLLSATLIMVGAIIIGLLGAGRLSFGEKPGGVGTLQKNDARFYVLTFKDVSKGNYEEPLRKTEPEYLKKLAYYLSAVELALGSNSLPNLLRVDILNLQQERVDFITVTALLAFADNAKNDTLSKETILTVLDSSKNGYSSNWRDIEVKELRGFAWPVPPLDTTNAYQPTGIPASIPQPAPIVTEEGRCECSVVDYCRDVVHYEAVHYPNPLGHENAKEVEAALGLFQLLDYHKCHPTIKNFTCLLLQPSCSNVTTSAGYNGMLPCASYCYDVASSCQHLLDGTYLEHPGFQCSSLPITNCSQVCLKEHFVCETTGLCLANSSRCNHRFECGPNDYSDERGCGCADPGKQQCPNGKCIEKRLFCDNKNDCGDWGDQVNCTCPAGFRRCKTTGQCFPDRLWCNDEFDCEDKSDEKNCSCTSADFQCQNGYCLNPDVRCNGANDCGDFSDEFNCECEEYQFRCDKYLCKNYINTWCDKRPHCDDGADEPVNCTCKGYQFRCDNGQCIPIYEKCDGKPQCDDNSDELHCACTKYEFKCPDGQCIAKEFVCDGKFHCKGGEDERQNCTCGVQRFPCDDGACLPVNLWCDKNKECRNGEDEPEDCDEKCPPGHPIKCINWRTGQPMCVHKLEMCNGQVLCMDGEDELGCSHDKNSSFSCPGKYNGTSIFLPWSKYCDGVQDCPHESEETGCTCDMDHQMSCLVDSRTITCISLERRCDGIVDCRNGIDEHECTCGEVLGSRQPERLCDGVPDCIDSTDELNKICKGCQFETHYACNDGSGCILQSQMCDGVKDCPSGDDEKYCWMLVEHEEDLHRFWEASPKGILYGRRGAHWAPVCATNVTDQRLLAAVCNHMGYE